MFVEGASLATSFLLQQKINKPHASAPFGFAILFNASLIVSPDEHFCEDVIVKEAAKAQKKSSSVDALNSVRPPLKHISKHRVPGKRSEVVSETLGLLDLSFAAAEKEGWMDRKTAFEGKTVSDLPRVIHPMMLDTRIDIPVTVIVGKEDPMFMFSLVQKKLCRKDTRKFVVHAGGHDVLRAGADLDAAVVGCKWVIEKARRTASTNISRVAQTVLISAQGSRYIIHLIVMFSAPALAVTFLILLSLCIATAPHGLITVPKRCAF
jgi:hypothetical protein